MGERVGKSNKSIVGTVMAEMVQNVAAGVEKSMSVAADRMICDNYIGKDKELSEEEKKERIDEYLSQHCEMEKLMYLTGTITLKCTLGQKEDTFMPEDHNVDINGEQAIASTDCKVGEHINGFGICMGSIMKEGKTTICKPKIAHGKWLESCTKMKVGDAEAVNENSYLICTRYEGAKIYPVILMEAPEALSVEEQIQNIMAMINGEEIMSYEGMVDLPTVEILARMIYQEDHEFKNGRQNAIVFTVVNRLYYGNYLAEDRLNEKKVNNIYGVLTSATPTDKEKWQYESIYNVEHERENAKKGSNNAYKPPIDEKSSEHEKEVWENAKRLAAILWLAVEEYGEGDENAKGKCVKSGDDTVRENIINFIQEQVDSQGNPIKNNIGNSTFFHSIDKSLLDEYKREGKIMLEEGEGNVFY